MPRTRIPFEVDPSPRKDDSVGPALSDENKTETPGNSSIFTVSQLTRKIRILLESRFRVISVEGELSNVHQAASGHWYFSLKDEEAQIRSVMFRQASSTLRFRPEDGLEVVVRGHLSVYTPRGEYQINSTSMEPKGIGALQLAFEQLKKRLSEEGLFSAELKRPIPSMPRCIGLITSSRGAAIHDLLSVLKRRFEGIPALLFPAMVQGEHAPAELIKGLEVLNNMRDSRKIDVIILGRGGGSLEDLWAFNDEALARSIRASRIPVISAVGHETDFTIADFASDLRAPTPSVAMEMAVPQKEEILERVGMNTKALERLLRQGISQKTERVSGLRHRLSSPRNTIQHYIQRVDDLDKLIQIKMGNTNTLLRGRVQSLLERLLLQNPGRHLELLKKTVTLYRSRLPQSIQILLEQHKKAWEHHSSLLDSLSPLAVMRRGFGIGEREDGTLLHSVNDVEKGDSVNLHLMDGRLETKVLQKRPSSRSSDRD